jgi:mono/diheme cytochrome c family protein
MGAFLAFSLSVTAMAFASDPVAPTFDKDIAPILFKHCANCHRPGEIGSSLSLMSYETARASAESIKEKVTRREMPPWPADSAHSLKLRNDPSLSEKEIKTLIAWVNAGAPKGNDADLPLVPNFPQGWLHPNGIAPDLVIPLPEFHVPATGEIPYVAQMVKVPFLDDKWVTAMQVRPGNRAIIHHMAITEVALDPGATPENLDELSRVAKQLGLSSGSVGSHPVVADPSNPSEYDMLGVYTPGSTIEMYGDDSAKVVKGGNNLYLKFNIHYQTTGKEETDQSMLAFWFLREPPEHQLFRVPVSGETIIAGGKELLMDTPGEKAEGTDLSIPPIPPFAENYEVIGITAYLEPITIYQLQPHAHLRGKDFKYAVVYPDGREETILTVPKYDFHWQLAYQLEEPLHLPAGSKLVVTAHYDNSMQNEHLLHHHHGDSHVDHNFSPEKEVHFREANQSWDEMFTPFIQYSIDNQNPRVTTKPQSVKTLQADPASDQHDQGAPELVQVIGCLSQTSSAVPSSAVESSSRLVSKRWFLTKGSEPTISQTQATSLAELKADENGPLGSERYDLIGVGAFSSSTGKTPNATRTKVAVKGVLFKNGKVRNINVTSLQVVGSACF